MFAENTSFQFLHICFEVNSSIKVKNISIDKSRRKNYYATKLSANNIMMKKDVNAIIIINIIISFCIGGRGAV